MRVGMLAAVVLGCAAACGGAKDQPVDVAKVELLIAEVEKGAEADLSFTRAMCGKTLTPEDLDRHMKESSGVARTMTFVQIMNAKPPEALVERIERMTVAQSDLSLSWGNILKARMEDRPEDEEGICAGLPKVEAELRAAVAGVKEYLAKRK